MPTVTRDEERAREAEERCVPRGDISISRVTANSGVPVESFDPVARPKHYNDVPFRCDHCAGTVQPIVLVRHLNFNRGNAVKYAARAGRKDPAKEIEDIEKAIWYLNDERERLRRMLP